MKTIYMPRLSNKIATITFILMIGIGFDASSAEASPIFSRSNKCPWPFYIQKISRVSVQDLSRLSPPSYKLNNFGGITFMRFGDEDYPTLKDMRAVAIFVVRSSDLGTSAAGFILYTNYDQFTNDTDGAPDNVIEELPKTATVNIEAYNEVNNCRVRSALSLNEKGEVKMGSKVIGQVTHKVAP